MDRYVPPVSSTGYRRPQSSVRTTTMSQWETPMESVSSTKPASPASGAPAGSSDSSGRPKTLDPAAIAAELAKLGTSARGLTTNEAQKRLAKDGPNAIIATEEPLWHKAVGYFWGPIPWMIEAAALSERPRSGWPRSPETTAPQAAAARS